MIDLQETDLASRQPPTARHDAAKPPHLHQLTALRGIAALWVVCFHFKFYFDGVPPPLASMIASGYLAVDFFFVLSGFVLCYGYGAALSKFTVSSLLQFYAFRLARIYPLHLAMLLAYLTIPFGLLLFSQEKVIPDRYDPWFFLANLFLIDAWPPAARLTWNIPSWSISAEFFAYLLFPALLAMLIRCSRNTAVAIGSTGLVLLGLVLLYRLHEVASLGNEVARLAVYRCLLQFMLGMLLCAQMASLRQFARPVHLVVLSLLVALPLFSPLRDYAYAPVFFMAVIFFAVDSDRLTKFLSSSILVYFGEISFSIYMTHYYIYDLAKFLELDRFFDNKVWFVVFCLATIIITSHLTYRYIEIPSQQFLKDRLNKRIGSRLLRAAG